MQVQNSEPVRVNNGLVTMEAIIDAAKQFSDDSPDEKRTLIRGLAARLRESDRVHTEHVGIKAIGLVDTATGDVSK